MEGAARRVILPDKTTIFNPRLASHNQRHRTWMADEKNSAKEDPSLTKTLPDIEATYADYFFQETGKYYNSLFFEEERFAGVISDKSGYVSIILFPETVTFAELSEVKLEQPGIDVDQPGPVGILLSARAFSMASAVAARNLGWDKDIFKWCIVGGDKGRREAGLLA